MLRIFTVSGVCTLCCLGMLVACGDESSRCDELVAVLAEPAGSLFDADTYDEFAERGQDWQATHGEQLAEFEAEGCSFPD